VLSRRWLENPQRVRIPLTVIFVALLAAVFLLPSVLSSLIQLPFAAKLLVSAALLAPLGFIMGMPFPTGLRALAGSGEDTLEWAWALNAGASVLGSVGAMVVAIQWGLNVALALGALAYVVATGCAMYFQVTKRAVHRVVTDAP
jgi:glucan phosphoethanolaminetransferase (alkaline phosphatase superfamily)